MGGKIKGAERQTPDLEQTRWAGDKSQHECKLSKNILKEDHNSFSPKTKKGEQRIST